MEPRVNEDKAARFHRLQRRCFWLSLATQAGTMLALVPGGVSGAHARCGGLRHRRSGLLGIDRRRLHAPPPSAAGTHRAPATFLPDLRPRTPLRSVRRSRARVDGRSHEGARDGPGARPCRGGVRVFRARAMAALVVGADRGRGRARARRPRPPDADRAPADVLPLQAARPGVAPVAHRVVVRARGRARPRRVRVGPRRQDPARERGARRHGPQPADPGLRHPAGALHRRRDRGHPGARARTPRPS